MNALKDKWIIVSLTIIILALITAATYLAETNHVSDFIKYVTVFGGLLINAAGIFGVQVRLHNVKTQVDQRSQEIKDTVTNGKNGNDSH